MEERRAREPDWTGLAFALAAAAGCTVLGLAMQGRFDPVNIAMVYLLGVVVSALRFSRGAAIVSAVLCVAAFDFFFIPPTWTFTVDDPQYLLTFAIMLIVALVISKLTADVHNEARRRGTLETEAQAERLRSTLLASISHDLRTPLAILSGASSSLAEEGGALTPEDRKALARSVFEQTRALSEQVAKVLQMTRLETGSVTIERDWNSLPDLAGPVLARLREVLARHRVMTDFDKVLPLMRVDATLIDQVLANLLENAARYTPPGTLIRLRAQVKDTEMVVSVEDFGGGLLAEDFERVFAKFHRGRNEGAVAGAGLGLSICRAIVLLHGGRIWVEQLAGGGTAFRFTLPLEAAPPVPAEVA